MAWPASLSTIEGWNITPIPYSAKRTAALIVAAGSGSRAGGDIPKQYRTIQAKAMLRHSVEAFASHADIDEIFVVIGKGQQEYAQKALNGIAIAAFIEGGATRQQSVYEGLCHIENAGDFGRVLIHDAARPFLSGPIIDALLQALGTYKGAVPALPIVDSIAQSNDGQTLSDSADRSKIWRIQTPQAFDLAAIFSAHQSWDTAAEATDDARMLMANGCEVAIVPGDEMLAKFTFSSDFAARIPQAAPMTRYRTGTGFDVHRLVPNEELWLCGIKIDYHLGLSGHSDADVALHALTDAVLGAAALGDIGEHFPPSDAQWRGARSDQFLEYAQKLAADKGYTIENVDITLICEAPKIGPHKMAMRERLAQILDLAVDDVSVKATTTERLGFTGRGEGIAAQACVTLAKQG